MATGPSTAREVIELVATVRDVCQRLEPDLVGLHDVSQVFDALVALERLAGGAVVRMSARYEEAGEWKRNGAKSPEDDLARKTGSGTGRARRKLSTSKRLGGQAKTDAAVRNGDLSPDQADAVSSGAAASPGDEDDLLASAKKDPLHELRRQAAAAKARADADREATRRRLHKQRSMRRWNDDDGMGNLLLRLPADEMAEVDAALKRPIEQRFADARDAGRFEPFDAYAADVVKDRLLGVDAGDAADRAGGSVARSKPAARSNQAVRPDKKVIALIDVEALNRGRVEGDETCEIAGVGPVSVSAVRALMCDAFLTVVFKKGVDVLNVTHLGRQVTATQRTALEARGGACERCGGTYLLDIDHNEGWTLTHDTRVEDLSWACWHCHDLKTRYDLRFVGPPGNRSFETRDGQPWNGPGNTDPPGGTDPPQDRVEPPVQDDLFTHAS